MTKLQSGSGNGHDNLAPAAGPSKVGGPVQAQMPLGFPRDAHRTVFALSMVLTVALGRIDHEPTSLGSLFQLQNGPAIVLYTAAFYLLGRVLVGGVSWARNGVTAS